MRLIDLNILLYATNADSPRHVTAHEWLQRSIAGAESVALPWAVLVGFLRIITSDRVFTKPMAADTAIAIVEGWLTRPNVVALLPGPNHWQILRSLLSGAGTAGNLTMDAHLAALAIEHGCELCTTDSDFARFPGLHWRNPL
ncbi:MAG: type II toxin-antitoxin system VapC family toxin [Gemmatimonadaceae bacterium]